MKYNNILPLHIIVVSDSHLLSSQLHDKGEMIRRISQKGDGKVLPYSEEIFAAFTHQILADPPNVLILTGDLSYNGERQSHLDLISYLEKMKAAGIKVLVIPGNHDINISSAAAFSKNQAWLTETVNHQEFFDLYGGFGYDAAIDQDSSSFSYVTELTDQLWLVTIDVNSQHNPRLVSDQTFQWLETALKKAKTLGKTVITATHQNILVHNQQFVKGFVIENHLKLSKLLNQYQVRLNLSGHIHLQHLVLEEKGLSEAATGSLAISPHPVGHIIIDESLHLHYETKNLDVTSWAKQYPTHDKNLQEFSTFSREYFYNISASKTGAELLKDPTIQQADLIRMAEFSAEVNRAYFSGKLHQLLPNPIAHPDYLLWQKLGQHIGFWKNLNSFFLQPLKDETTFSLSLLPTNG